MSIRRIGRWAQKNRARLGEKTLRTGHLEEYDFPVSCQDFRSSSAVLFRAAMFMPQRRRVLAANYVRKDPDRVSLRDGPENFRPDACERLRSVGSAERLLLAICRGSCSGTCVAQERKRLEAKFYPPEMQRQAAVIVRETGG
jgi:hypothetical protein